MARPLPSKPTSSPSSHSPMLPQCVIAKDQSDHCSDHTKATEGTQGLKAASCGLPSCLVHRYARGGVWRRASSAQ